MARKDYELAFQLSAQVNNTFQAQFNAAGKAISDLQRKIDDINRAQSDIKSYQRLQNAITETQEKLAKLRQEYDKLNDANSENNAFGLPSDSKLEEKRAQIEKLETSLESYNTKLNDVGQKLQNAGVNTKDLANEESRLKEETKSLKKEQDDAAESAQNFGQKGVEAMQAMNDAITTLGLVDTMQKLAEEFMNCVNTAAAFEETMSTVEALSGATSSEMEDLSQLAKDLGAATQYSAQESAEAMTYMAMAGWDTEDMLNGMSGVMDLAAASGEDLATVSDIVTDSMTAFGLTASDTAHYADVLAAAATNSNTDVATMGETFQYCAPLAGALGYSVEDVATMVGLMANSGVKASNSGTALRTMFTKLTDGATLTADAFGEYTIETQNADGTMRSLSDVVTDLRSAFAQMTEAEKVANAETLVGKYAMTGFVTLMNSTEDDFDSLSESINNCSGAAAEMSEIKLDNMNGSLELAKSAWEGVTIAIGEDFTPILSTAYETLAEVGDAVRVFIEENPALVKAITTSAATFGVLTTAVTAVNTAIKVTKMLNIASLFTGPVGGIMAAAGAITALVGLFTAYNTAVNEGVDSVSDLADSARDLRDAMDEANDTYSDTIVSTQATADVASMYIDRLEEIEEATGGNVEGNQEYSNLLTLLCQQVPDLTSYIDTETNSIEGGTEALREHIEAWKEDAKTQAQQEYINGLMDEYNDVLMEQAENEIKLTDTTTKREAAEEKLKEVYEQLDELYPDRAELEQRAAAGEIVNFSDEYWELQEAAQGYRQEIYKLGKEEDNLDAAMKEGEAAATEAEQAITDAQNAIEAMSDETSGLTDEEQRLAEEESEVTNRIAETTNEIDEMIEAYQEVYDEAYKSITGQYSLWDTAASVTSTSAATINAAMESQITYWSDYNDNLAKLNDRTSEIEGLSDVIASFADGSEDSVNAIAGMAAASDEELEEMVKNYQELQAEQEEVSAGIADLSTELDETMKLMTEDLAEDIDAMDLSDEAAQSGAATIQGYIEGLESQSPELQAAAQSMLDIVNSVLWGSWVSSGTSSNGYNGMPSSVTSEISGKDYTLSSSESGGGYSPQSSTGRNGMPSSLLKQMGYASGTDNATAGVHLVGENGPELMAFGGGEKVLNAAQTKEVLTDTESCTGATAAGSANITYAPVLNLTGTSVTQEQAQSALNEAQSKFETWFKDYMRQQQRLSFA